MPAPVFIGDEISAAGYRLAGLEVHSPSDEELPALFRRVRESAELILLDVEYAHRLPQAEVRAAVRALHPRLLIVPDIRGQHRMRDMFQRVRGQLGVNL